MTVNYNKYAETFSNSRKNMKWEEIEYFISFLKLEENLNILDIGCGNGRFLGALKNNEISINRYLGVDLSEGLLNEAKKINPDNDFLELNMLNIDNIKGETYDYIFFIASFHHLDNIEDRLSVLKKVKTLLKPEGKIFMTNWSLNSELNKKRYSKAIIPDSENKYGSMDYSIKIGEFNRYYHSFDLSELEYLFNESGFEIIENKEFENRKNFVSIIKKI